MNWITRLLGRGDNSNLKNKTENDILSLPTNIVSPTYSDKGVFYTFPNLADISNTSNGLMEWAVSSEHRSLLALYLAQLVSDGIAQINENSFLLVWSDIYYLYASSEHADSLYLL